MQVFISWSGERSKSLALALRRWLPSVLQSLEPYVSSEDIEKGARWSTDIARRLDDSSFGIVCVTSENVKAPWLNFEAGALAKSFDTSRMSPFLLGLVPTDITGPLAQFQATLPNLEDVSRLVHSLNAATDRPLDEARLEAAVRLWWPQLEEQISRIPESEKPPEAASRDENEVLREVLALSRNMQLRLSRLEDHSSFASDPVARMHNRREQEVATSARAVAMKYPSVIQSTTTYESGDVQFRLNGSLPKVVRRRIVEELVEQGAESVSFALPPGHLDDDVEQDGEEASS